MSRMERLLPLGCLLAALVLFASELMTMFELIPPGGEVLDSQGAGERHGNAMLVIAVCAVVALAVAVLAGSQPAAVAVAALGGVALLIFLLVDVPDAGQVGTLDDARQSFFDAEAVPDAGFWLAMLGSLGLAVSGTALATLPPEQLRALRPGAGGRERAGSEAEPAQRTAAPKRPAAGKAAGGGERPAHRRAVRPRTRPRR